MRAGRSSRVSSFDRARRDNARDKNDTFPKPLSEIAVPNTTTKFHTFNEASIESLGGQKASKRQGTMMRRTVKHPLGHFLSRYLGGFVPILAWRRESKIASTRERDTGSVFPFSFFLLR